MQPSLPKMLVHGKTVYKWKGHKQEDDDGGNKKPEHSVTPVRNISTSPESGADKERCKVRAEYINIETGDWTDVRIEGYPLCNRVGLRNQKVIDPRNMKRDGTGENGSESKGFVNALCKESKHTKASIQK